MKIYWHRQLPPVKATVLGEHTIEAESLRVPAASDRHLWDRCVIDLAGNVERRLEQEGARLGGDYAHVLDEHVDTKHDEARDERWLHGRYTYVLYREDDLP